MNNNNNIMLLAACFSILSSVSINAGEHPHNKSIPTLNFSVPEESPVAGGIMEAVAPQVVRSRGTSYEANKSSSSGNATPLTATPTISTTPSFGAQDKGSTFGQSIKSDQPAQQPAQKVTKEKVTTKRLNNIATQIDVSAANNAKNRKKVFSGSATASRAAEYSAAQITAAGIDPDAVARIAASGKAHLESRQSRRNLNNPKPAPTFAQATPRVHGPIGRKLSQAAAAEDGTTQIIHQNFTGGSPQISITGAAARVVIHNNNMMPPAQNPINTNNNNPAGPCVSCIIS